jgi:hypothetical protein
LAYCRPTFSAISNNHCKTMQCLAKDIKDLQYYKVYGASPVQTEAQVRDTEHDVNPPLNCGLKNPEKPMCVRTPSHITIACLLRSSLRGGGEPSAGCRTIFKLSSAPSSFKLPSSLLAYLHEMGGRPCC